jgi:hypothetical protein
VLMLADRHRLCLFRNRHDPIVPLGSEPSVTRLLMLFWVLRSSLEAR